MLKFVAIKPSLSQCDQDGILYRIVKHDSKGYGLTAWRVTGPATPLLWTQHPKYTRGVAWLGSKKACADLAQQIATARTEEVSDPTQ